MTGLLSSLPLYPVSILHCHLLSTPPSIPPLYRFLYLHALPPAGTDVLDARAGVHDGHPCQRLLLRPLDSATGTTLTICTVTVCRAGAALV